MHKKAHRRSRIKFYISWERFSLKLRTVLLHSRVRCCMIYSGGLAVVFSVRHSRTTLITEAATLHFGGFYWSPAGCIEGLFSGRQLMILSVPAESGASLLELNYHIPSRRSQSMSHVHHTLAKYFACVVVCWHVGCWWWLAEWRVWNGWLSWK